MLVSKKKKFKISKTKKFYIPRLNLSNHNYKKLNTVLINDDLSIKNRNFIFYKRQIKQKPRIKFIRGKSIELPLQKPNKFIYLFKKNKFLGKNRSLFYNSFIKYKTKNKSDLKLNTKNYRGFSKILTNKGKDSYSVLNKNPFDIDIASLNNQMLLSKKRIFRSVSTAVAVGHNINLEDVYNKQFFLNFFFEDIQKKFINIIMKDGKKALALFLYKMSIFIIKGNVKKRFKYVLQKALLNVCPFFYYRLEFRSGRIFKFPKYISETFRVFLGIKYMVDSVKRGFSNFYSNFAFLIFQTSFGKGEAVRKKKELYQMLVDFRALHRFRSFFSFPYFRFRHNFYFSKRKKRLFRHYKAVNRAKDYFRLSYIKQRVKGIVDKKNTFFQIVADRFKVVKRILLSYFFHSFYFFDSFDYNKFRFNVNTLWGIFGFLRYVIFFDAYAINVISPKLILNYMFYIVNLNITLTFIVLFDIFWKLLTIFQLQFLKLYKLVDSKFHFVLDKNNIVLQDTDFFHLLNNSFVVFKYNQVKQLLLGQYYPQFLDSVSKLGHLFNNNISVNLNSINDLLLIKKVSVSYYYVYIYNKFKFFFIRLRLSFGYIFFHNFIKTFFYFMKSQFSYSFFFLLQRGFVFFDIYNFYSLLQNKHLIYLLFSNYFTDFINLYKSPFLLYLVDFYFYFRIIFINYIYLYYSFFKINFYYNVFNRIK